MPKYTDKSKISEKTKEDALKVARATQRPGQNKEQTRLIAQGIQKGIDQYKKQQNTKARELDKRLKNLTHASSLPSASSDQADKPVAPRGQRLPWLLLLLSWLLMAAYVLLTR